MFYMVACGCEDTH